MIFCSVLNPSIDVIYSVDELRSGQTYTDIPHAVIPAGKGINVAKVVKTLSEDVCVVGMVPEYDSKRISDYLDILQIGHQLFPVPGGARINTTMLEKKTGDVTHISSKGLSLPPRLQIEFMQFFSGVVAKDDIWCFSGSVPDGIEMDIYSQMLKICNEKENISLLDTRGEALKFGARAKPMMIKPNLTELESFFDEQIQGVHHIALKGKRLIDTGIGYVFISLGADGVIALHENECLLCSAPQIKAVDTVGCGDAFVGGLLVSKSRNFSFSEMCRMAIACGSSNAMHEGPGIITQNEVWQLMEDVQITAV